MLFKNSKKELIFTFNNSSFDILDADILLSQTLCFDSASMLLLDENAQETRHESVKESVIADPPMYNEYYYSEFVHTPSSDAMSVMTGSTDLEINDPYRSDTTGSIVEEDEEKLQQEPTLCYCPNDAEILLTECELAKFLERELSQAANDPLSLMFRQAVNYNATVTDFCFECGNRHFQDHCRTMGYTSDIILQMMDIALQRSDTTVAVNT